MWRSETLSIRLFESATSVLRSRRVESRLLPTGFATLRAVRCSISYSAIYQRLPRPVGFQYRPQHSFRIVDSPGTSLSGAPDLLRKISSVHWVISTSLRIFSRLGFSASTSPSRIAMTLRALSRAAALAGIGSLGGTGIPLSDRVSLSISSMFRRKVHFFP